MMLSTYGFSRNRYLRLMTISLADIFGTIPLATSIIVSNAKAGIEPWKGWADTHRHYSVVVQVPGFEWKNIPEVARAIEMFRWSLVACAFLFFALYGFAAGAREHYYRLYKSLARCIGYSISTPHVAPHACVLVAHLLCWYVLTHLGYMFPF
jgi:pheromone a factor receptor